MTFMFRALAGRVLVLLLVCGVGIVHARLRRAGLELFAIRLRQQGIRPWPLLLCYGHFSDKICAAAGIRRTQKRLGRPAGKTDQPGNTEMQTDFGF